MKVVIEEARPEHVEDIQEVFYRTWLATYPNEEAGITVDDIEERFKDRHSSERILKRRKDIASQDTNKKFLVAFDDGKVIGLCRVSKDDTANKLNAIYVLPEYQGKGIGTILWNEAKKFFDPSKDILVGVAPYNKAAISFYSKLGFVDTGRRYDDERMRMKSGATLPQMEMVIAVV